MIDVPNIGSVPQLEPELKLAAVELLLLLK
jgi:hypothetical protein